MKAHSGEEEYFSFRIHDAGGKWEWTVNFMPRPLHLRKRPGTHWKGGFMGLGAGTDGLGNPTHWGSNTEPPSQQQVTIPTTLSWPHYVY
jgi:hypothetical protein